MGTEGYSEGSDENNRDIDNDQDESIQVIIPTPLLSFQFSSIFILTLPVLFIKEPMDTSESILSKSLTSQTTANASASSKEPSPRKDNVDNSASGMFALFIFLTLTLVFKRQKQMYYWNVFEFFGSFLIFPNFAVLTQLKCCPEYVLKKKFTFIEFMHLSSINFKNCIRELHFHRH